MTMWTFAHFYLQFYEHFFPLLIPSLFLIYKGLHWLQSSPVTLLPPGELNFPDKRLIFRSLCISERLLYCHLQTKIEIIRYELKAGVDSGPRAAESGMRRRQKMESRWWMTMNCLTQFPLYS